MRIALAQINPCLGDFEGNAAKILDFSQRAADKRADLVVFSELSLFGYPAYDWLENPVPVLQQLPLIKKIISQLPKGPTFVFGALVPTHAKKSERPYQNAAIVARRGSKPQFFVKQLLPSYDVFDETRFFEPGHKTGVIAVPRVGRVAITVCEDMWCDDYAQNPLGGLKKIDLIVNISASPFSPPHNSARLKTAGAHARKLKSPFVYVNQTGGQDEVIFDGRSFVLDAKGKIVVQAAAFEEDLVMTDLKAQRSEHRPEEESSVELLRKALVTGLRDFVFKTEQKSVVLGLSGGVDSALVAALAVDALGPSRVTGLILPGPYSSVGSWEDAEKLADGLKIKTFKVSINDLFERAKSVTSIFKDGVDEKTISLMEQNIQARLRGLILMSYSNAKQAMLLTTGNKSELASGYCTLYGDMCGGLNPLGDLTKKQVYELASHYNSGRELIPKNILEKSPSAELAPNQKDQDTLPPYDKLDQSVVKIVEEMRAPTDSVDRWLWEALSKSEFKRWQSPPILRVSKHAFGRGRRVPIAKKF